MFADGITTVDSVDEIQTVPADSDVRTKYSPAHRYISNSCGAPKAKDLEKEC